MGVGQVLIQMAPILGFGALIVVLLLTVGVRFLASMIRPGR